MLGLGALGVVAAPTLQRGLESFLGGAADKDPTGLTGPAPQRRRLPLLLGHLVRPAQGRAADYRLTVDGLVDRPTTYTLADLRALPQTRLVRDVQCVTGWRVPDTPFEGVRLSAPPGRRGGALLGRGDAVHLLRRRVQRRASPWPRPAAPTSWSRCACRTRPSATPTAARSASTSPPCTSTSPPSGSPASPSPTDVRPGYWEDRGYDVDAWVGRSNGRDDEPTELRRHRPRAPRTALHAAPRRWVHRVTAAAHGRVRGDRGLPVRAPVRRARRPPRAGGHGSTSGPGSCCRCLSWPGSSPAPSARTCGRLNRFGPHDRTWLRAALRRDARPERGPRASSTRARSCTRPGSPGRSWSCSAPACSCGSRTSRPLDVAHRARPSSTTGWP